MKGMLGKIKAAGLAGVKAWREHDARETWHPGDISALLAPLDDVKVRLQGDMEAHVADQVKEAVYEHTRDGVWFMGASKEGRLLVGLDVGNEVAPLLVKVGLLDLMNATLKEAYGNIASQDSQDVVAALQAFVRQLSALKLEPQRPAGQQIGAPVKVATSQMGGKKVPVISRNMPPDPRMEAQQ